jgi:hypothetical protein
VNELTNHQDQRSTALVSLNEAHFGRIVAFAEKMALSSLVPKSLTHEKDTELPF